MKIGLIVALAASLGQLVTGHTSAIGVARNQPEKFAAMEAHFRSAEPADLNLFGVVNEKTERVDYGVSLSGFSSFLLHGNFKAPVQGLESTASKDRPPVQVTFQAYHLMIFIGSF